MKKTKPPKCFLGCPWRFADLKCSQTPSSIYFFVLRILNINPRRHIFFTFIFVYRLQRQGLPGRPHSPITWSGA